MANEKLNQIATLIYEKTKAGEVQWEKTSNKRSFQTAFPNYAVVIGDNALTPNLAFYNEQGELIEEMKWATAPGPYDRQLVELYELARRQALGAEKALDDLLGILTRPASSEKK